MGNTATLDDEDWCFFEDYISHEISRCRGNSDGSKSLHGIMSKYNFVGKDQACDGCVEGRGYGCSNPTAYADRSKVWNGSTKARGELPQHGTEIDHWSILPY